MKPNRFSITHAYSIVIGTVILGCLLVAAALAMVPATAASSSTPTSLNPQAVATPCLPTWVVVTSPNVGISVNHLSGIAAISSDDVWTVGYYQDSNNARQTLVEHWDGSAWSVVDSPSPSATKNALNGIAAISSDDVWTVGYYVDDTAAYLTLIEHWDGSTWSIVPSSNPSTSNNILFAIAAVSASDVWAVGYYSDNGPGLTLVEHWTGGGWNVIASPNVGSSFNDLTGVSTVSAGDVWAVGGYEDGSNPNQTLAEHWDGSTWSVVTDSNPGTFTNEFYGVSAVSASDVWAVGDYSNGSAIYLTLIEHWDGSAWGVVPSPSPSASLDSLTGVSAVSATDVWAVGDFNGASQTLVEHWDGSTWSVVDSPNFGTSPNFLHGISAVSATDVWAVGDFNNGQGAIQTLTVHYTVQCPTPTNTPAVQPTQCTIQFSDVPSNSTFYQWIRCLACRDILGGYPDGTFRPGRNVTRGQLSKIVANAAGFSEAHTQQSFQDVPASSTFYQYIERMSSRSIVGGYPCGGAGEPCVPPANLPYFRPNNNATRGQISKIDVLAAQQVLGWQLANPPDSTFQDVAPGSTFYEYIETAVAHSVLNGYPCGTPPAGACVPPADKPYFLPANNTTRGQISKIVANTFFPNCITP